MPFLHFFTIERSPSIDRLYRPFNCRFRFWLFWQAHFTISTVFRRLSSRFHELHHHQAVTRLLLNGQLRELSGDDRGSQSKREVRVRHHTGAAEPDLQVSTGVQGLDAQECAHLVVPFGGKVFVQKLLEFCGPSPPTV